MVVRITKYRAFALTAALAASFVSAASFDVPREGPVAFRRDRIPLNVDEISALSLRLTILAKGQKQDNPRNRRATAQMLALALALDPTDEEAKATLDFYAKGNIPRSPDEIDLERAITQLWKAVEWLRTKEAGDSGRALAHCLIDILVAANPDLPEAAPFRKKRELGAWTGWVGNIEAFQDAEVVEKQEVSKPVPALPTVPETKIQLATATLATPLWARSPSSDEITLHSVQVSMTAAAKPPIPDAPPQPLGFSIDHTEENNFTVRMNRVVSRALTKQLGKLPSDSQVTFNLGAEVPYLLMRNHDALSGTAAVLVGAAVSAREPTGTVIGVIDAQGGYRMTADFWERLRSISKEAGGRLVIPAEAAEFLPSILALEDPEFFLKFDVLLASNLTELLDRSAKISTSPLAEWLARAQDIRAKGASFPVGQYVSNRFVRQRLVELSSEATYFVSPKMLAIQGAGERPTRLPRRVLACELRRVLQPISWIPEKPMADIDLTLLDRSFEACRSEIDRLERYVDSVDRDFFMRAREMTATFRAFARASKVSANRESGPATTALAYEAMKKSYADVVAELNTAANPNPPPSEDDPISE